MLKDRGDGNERIKIPTAVKIAYRVLFCIFLAIFIFVEAKTIQAMSAPKKSDLEYVIVLGAGVNGTVPKNPLRVRIERAAEYMSENEDTILIASGGQGSGEDISEAECIRSILVGELPQPALRLGWGFLLRNGTPEGVPHYHHSVC